MLMNAIGGGASNFTALHLDTDELVVLNRLLAKASITSSSRSAKQVLCSSQAIDMAERLYKFRRSREVQAEHAFGGGLFADPAWDIMLDLFIHDARGLSVSVSSACQGSVSPATTALRHLAELERRGIVHRRPHPSDRRVMNVRLSNEALNMMNTVLAGFVDLFGLAISDPPQDEPSNRS